MGNTESGAGRSREDSPEHSPFLHSSASTGTPSHQGVQLHQGTPAEEDILAGLNPQQREAVIHRGSPLLIIAGAGSGKTSVLTRRIAYLLRHGAAPWEILAITFTNKAAAEMRERVTHLVGSVAERMWVSTFHSLCVRILRAHAHLVEGLNTNFTIYDSDDAKRLVTMVIKDYGLDLKEYSPRGALSIISNWKNELLTPPEALRQAQQEGNTHLETIAALYKNYQQRLREANCVDFDDLIGDVVAIMQQHPQVAQHYRHRFRHVLVDEYQDTNHAQYVLISALVGTGREKAELCVVGDADQSIYAFRGATIRNIEEFERDYPAARTIMLEQNYRSTQTILDAANALIGQNHHRRPKQLWSDLGTGTPIYGYVADNEHDEARFIADQVDNLVENGGFRYRDIAIMYRTNNASRALEDVFIRSGLAYKVVGGTRFYERKEIRDVVAYLKVIDNPEDTVALRRIINTPRRGIGDRALAQVTVYAENNGISWASALEAAAQAHIPRLSGRGRNAIAGFLEMMQRLRKDVAHADVRTSDGHSVGLPDVGKIISAIIDTTGYREELEKSSDPQDGVRLDNLQELVAVGHEFSQEAAHLKAYMDMPGDEGEEMLAEGEVPPGSIQAFLERVSLVADADHIPAENQDMLTLMTLHTAKGLEFPVVFLTGWEDGQFPHMRAMSDPAELSEERRLAYVGITRAQQRLFIVRAVTRSGWGQAVSNPPSRFISEVPQELWEWIREEPAAYSDTDWGTTSRSTQRAVHAQRSNCGSANSSALQLEVGDRVNHDKYGLGTVTSVDRVGAHATAIIDFGGSGTVRMILVGGLPMEKL